MGLTSRLLDLIRPQRAMVVPWDSGDPFTSPWFNFGGNIYPLGLNQTMPNSKQEEIEQTFEGYVQGAHRANGIIFACAAAHLRLFSQARFQWQRMSGGRPGDLFGTQALAILERPEPNAVTADLLARASLDADYGGNYFATLRNGRIKRMRPTWVDIILGSDQDPDVTAQDLDAEVLGYVYWPGGKRRGGTPVPLLANEVCHYAPLPDPLASYRGMSWITPIVREVMGDSAVRDHKLAFFENGATVNLVVKRQDSLDRTAFDTWVTMVKTGHQGVANAYKMLFLDSGADAAPIGANNQEAELKIIQAAGEVRQGRARRRESIRSSSASPRGCRARPSTPATSPPPAGSTRICGPDPLGPTSRARWRRSSPLRPGRGSGTTTATSRSSPRTRKTRPRSSRSRHRASAISSTAGSRPTTS
jgi:hypothetical protein